MRGGFPAKRNFRAVDAEDPRITARCAACCHYRRSRYKTQFHQADSGRFRQVQVFQNSLFAFPKITDMNRGRTLAAGGRPVPPLETELHVSFSIRLLATPCQGSATK